MSMTIEEAIKHAGEAANIVASECPYDIDGAAAVTDLDTDEQVEVY